MELYENWQGGDINAPQCKSTKKAKKQCDHNSNQTLFKAYEEEKREREVAKMKEEKKRSKELEQEKKRELEEELKRIDVYNQYDDESIQIDEEQVSAQLEKCLEYVF